jgi:uncharacterized radical SAM superfamily protein
MHEFGMVAQDIYEANFGKKIEFVYPNLTKAISLTSNECALNCAHCNKQWLKGMYTSSEIDVNARSILLSGGCDLNGRVPLKENFELIRELSTKTKLIAHTGLVKNEDIEKIAPYIVSASFNFIGDNSTIKEVYGLKKREVNDFIESYLTLKKYVNVYPHITIGIHGGKIKGENNAISILKSLGTEAIVFNVFIPTPNTLYYNKKPPKVDETLEIIKHARLEFPNTPLYLGCMRPRGRYRRELDEQVVGIVNRIVLPANSAIKKAEVLNYEIKKLEECCII